MWAHACGGIVTTSGQASALKAHFPQLPILVRPNGFNTVALSAADVSSSSSRAATDLRLVHYGNLYGARLDPQGLMARLAASGHWKRVVLCQYGHDWNGTLERLSDVVEVETRPIRPWGLAARDATQFDAALVIGNLNPSQLPSKAVQYLTLPIPRIALGGHSMDALAAYVQDKPGWLVVTPDDPRAADRVRQLVEHRWTLDQLAPGIEESWEAVERRLAEFVLSVTGMGAEPAPSAILPSPFEGTAR
jgi:hypothetical protein